MQLIQANVLPDLPPAVSNLNAVDGSIIHFPLEDGAPDSYSIVRWLNYLAVQFSRMADLRTMAELVLPETLSDNDLGGIKVAALDFVKSAIKYVPDPLGTEYVYSPLYQFKQVFTGKQAIGDCDDHALMLAAILLTFGIDAQIIGVKESPASQWFDHVIVGVLNSAGQVAFMDPCAKYMAAPDYSAEMLLIAPYEG